MVEKKSATIYVNMKSITGGYEEKEDKEEDKNNTTSTNNSTSLKKKAKLKVQVVDGDCIYDNDVDKNETKFNTGNNKLTGTGVVTVKVYIDGVIEREKEIDLNTINGSYTFE